MGIWKGKCYDPMRTLLTLANFILNRLSIGYTLNLAHHFGIYPDADSRAQFKVAYLACKAIWVGDRKEEVS